MGKYDDNASDELPVEGNVYVHKGNTLYMSAPSIANPHVQHTRAYAHLKRPYDGQTPTLASDIFH